METRSRKRNRSDNGEIAPKRSRKAAETKNLADLNEDVLTQIFEYLDTEEMIDIIKAGKIFLESSQRAFQRKFKNKYIELPLVGTTNAFNRSIEVIRYFGKHITKLKLNYGILDGSRNKQIHDLVMKICNEALIEINFCELSTDLKINKCFPNLKTLDVFGGRIDGSVCELGKWFPAVENFIISCVNNIVTILDTRRNIASLKCFKMDFCILSLQKFNIGQLNNFIKCNPQVNDLSLTLSEEMFNSSKKVVINTGKSDRDAIPYEKMMTVKLLMYGGTLADLVIPYERIKQFELISFQCSEHEQICGFISKCVNLRILKLDMSLCCQRNNLHDTFSGVDWIAYAKHVRLTQLIICFRASAGRARGNPFNIGLLAIQPYLQQSELNTVKLSYVSNLKESWMKDVNLFDTFGTKINLNIWSLTQENSNDQISLTLNKITPQK